MEVLRGEYNTAADYQNMREGEKEPLLDSENIHTKNYTYEVTETQKNSNSPQTLIADHKRKVSEFNHRDTGIDEHANPGETRTELKKRVGEQQNKLDREIDLIEKQLKQQEQDNQGKQRQMCCSVQ